MKPLSTLASGAGVTAHTSLVVGPYYESSTDYTRTAKITIARSGINNHSINIRKIPGNRNNTITKPSTGASPSATISRLPTPPLLVIPLLLHRAWKNLQFNRVLPIHRPIRYLTPPARNIIEILLSLQISMALGIVARQTRCLREVYLPQPLDQ